MAKPTLLTDIIQPHWQSLTPEQRTCWHFWALTHPQITQAGRLISVYGQQAHNARNSNIAVAEGPPMLTDPPPTDEDPPRVTVEVAAWPLYSELPNGFVVKNGNLTLNFPVPIPDGVTVVITHGYDQKKSGKGRRPQIRHVTVKFATEEGPLSLIIPVGYYATTNGQTKYARIKGITAKRRPDLPVGKMKVIKNSTGKMLRQALPNPYGGTSTGITRPDHSDGPQAGGRAIIAPWNDGRTDYIYLDNGSTLTT